MAALKPTQKTISDFNGGEKYIDDNPVLGLAGDSIQAETINNLIESQMWVQSLATTEPDTTQANNVGEPDVSITVGNDGLPKFKFSNIKGEPGEKGDTGDSVDTTARAEIAELRKDIENAVPPASTATPLMDGTASVGTSTSYARGDHRHPQKIFQSTATIPTTGWVNNRISVSVYGATVTSSAQVFPTDDSAEEWINCDIQAKSIGNGIMDFTCGIVPTTPLTATVIIILL